MGKSLKGFILPILEKTKYERVLSSRTTLPFSSRKKTGTVFLYGVDKPKRNVVSTYFFFFFFISRVTYDVSRHQAEHARLVGSNVIRPARVVFEIYRARRYVGPREFRLPESRLYFFLFGDVDAVPYSVRRDDAAAVTPTKPPPRSRYSSRFRASSLSRRRLLGTLSRRPAVQI